MSGLQVNKYMHKASFKKDAAYVYGGYFLRYVSVLILVPYYGRVLGPVSYGKVLAAMSLMGIVWMAVNYGLSTTGARELAIQKDDALRGKIFGAQIMARLILVPVGIVIGTVGTFLSPALSEDLWYGVIGTLLGILAAMNLGWYFQGLRKFRTSIALEVITFPLNVLFVMLFVRDAQGGLRALLGLLASLIIHLVISYVVSFRTLKASKIVLCDGIREIKSATAIFLQLASSTMMTSGSTYLLSVFSSPEQVGYFGSVERLISLGLSFLGPAGQVLMPTIAHHSAHAPSEVDAYVRKGVLFEVSYGICACVAGAGLAPYLVPIIFGAKFQPSIPIMQIMVFVLPFAAFSHAFGLYVLVPQRREKAIAWAVSAGAFLNLLIIASFSQQLGGKGVAIARLGGECVTALFLMVVAARMVIGRSMSADHTV